MKQQIGYKFAEAAHKDDLIINGVRASGLIISPALYHSYIEQYDLAQRLALTLDNVMKDGEHKLIMEEALRQGYIIPNEAFFQQELNIYRDFLNSFNPYDITITKDGRTRLPVQTARALHFMTEYNRTLAEYILVSVLHTQYLRRFTELKEAGFPYAGPTALQETINILAAYTKTAKEEGQQRSLYNAASWAPPPPAA